ncbi:hypothetical protein FRACYDRAFT_244361 [Fragilariopsis cylindrus CCMP1102]|uniref:Uncharacterized protein n=1 Tax=Fragilariopsis cylindrus CCMP1102 TaxID=635003 RepID=A0A1E7F1L6_9STRA|nr:hypothetical protein FRACYDRAFT_244361 [Fragilariopsis cylindrus CCMP1102]|eukprot:OEU12101.1 hypothetical protein FRACYDRAFT_244361 [Fragilariopsis cylindrus CCMP1102]
MQCLCSRGMNKNNFAQGVACKPEALIVTALGGLVYFMSICVEISVKIYVGVFSSQHTCTLPGIFFRVVTTAAEQPNIKYYGDVVGIDIMDASAPDLEGVVLCITFK